MLRFTSRTLVVRDEGHACAENVTLMFHFQFSPQFTQRNPRIEFIGITLPFHQCLFLLVIATFYFFNAKGFLSCFLQFLFIKRSCDFFSLQIDKFICHGICVQNLVNSENFFRSIRGETLVEDFSFIF